MSRLNTHNRYRCIPRHYAPPTMHLGMVCRMYSINDQYDQQQLSEVILLIFGLVEGAAKIKGQIPRETRYGAGRVR
jgi:hypothetical protein